MPCGGADGKRKTFSFVVSVVLLWMTTVKAELGSTCGHHVRQSSSGNSDCWGWSPLEESDEMCPVVVSEGSARDSSTFIKGIPSNSNCSLQGGEIRMSAMINTRKVKATLR